MNPIVVDLSHWNPTPDWAALKAGGTVGVIHKATEGTGNVDGTLFDRAKAAMAVGLKWSTYHFLRPGSLPQQMDHYLKTINPVQGERVCLDYEDTGVHIGDLEYCVNYIRGKRPDLQITIYSGHVIKEQLGSKTSQVLATTSLWLAQYSTTPSWPTQVWPTWSLWQYTDKATVQGINAPVDGDKFNGSSEQCLAWFGPAGTVPEPQPKRIVYVSAPADVEVRVSVIQESAK
jgi:GH25 family lysozyme M1 (1,4-beta-N-acetylmuramidase)